MREALIRSTRWLPLVAALLVAGLAGAVSACGDSVPSTRDGSALEPDQETATARFEEIFREERRIRLEETDSVVISEIHTLAVGPDGTLVIPDQQAAEVLLYDPEGSLKRTLGRSGEGPGEYRTPVDAAFDADGYLYVSDGPNQRVTLYTPGFRYDTVFPVTNALYLYPLVGLEEGFAAVRVRGPRQHRDGMVGFYDRTGSMRASVHRANPALYSVPYWFSALGRSNSGFRLARSADRIYTGNALTYPVVSYEVDSWRPDTLGRPPRSWAQASRPERGAFASQPTALKDFKTWLRSFTTIDRIEVVDDTLLLVSHRKLDPEVMEYQESSYTADIYTLSGRKLVQEIDLPGQLLHADSLVYFTTDRPPGPWRVGLFRIDELE